MVQQVRKDWWVLLIVGLILLVIILLVIIVPAGTELASGSALPLWSWACLGAMAWCLALVVLAGGMKYLTRSNRFLQYCLGVIVAFYVLHFPVIATIDYLLFGYWDLSVNPLLGWMLVLVAMAVVTLALIELVVRPIPPLRFLLGVSRRRLPSLPTSGVKESTPVK